MKNILITGTSSGFGKIIAETLHAKGHTVMGTSRNPNKVSVDYAMLPLDVTKEESVTNVIDQFLQLHGKIDVLINNAGFGISGPVEDTRIEEAKFQLETNFFGAARMIQATLPHMRKNGGGLIINICSIGGQIGMPFQGFYSASKFALEGLTEALRIEVRPFNIHITNINPGDFATNFTENRQLTKTVSAPYESKFNAALRIYEKDEKNGSDPKILANLIVRLIAKKKNYRVRYLVGNFMQKMGVRLKKIMGSRTFESLMINLYDQK